MRSYSFLAAIYQAQIKGAVKHEPAEKTIGNQNEKKPEQIAFRLPLEMTSPHTSDDGLSSDWIDAGLFRLDWESIEPRTSIAEEFVRLRHFEPD